MFNVNMKSIQEQKVNETIFKELIKRGYSKKNGTRVWDISDSKLWYLTPELSKGFLSLKKYNPYRKNVVDREIALIKKNASLIVNQFGKKSFNLVDLGSGNGTKGEAFIRSIKSNVKFRYCPVDINPYYIETSSEKINALRSPNVASIKPFVSDFENLGNIVGLLRSANYQNNLIMLFGETISHYDINDFLYHLSDSMFRGDTVIIGNGIQKGKNRFTDIKKYKNALFNDWFIHVMNGLGFGDDEVEYDARFNKVRVEGFYRIKVDKTIQMGNKKVQFKKGDEVVVGIGYKYFDKELKKFCNMYFKQVTLMPDEDGLYCLLVCVK